MTNWIIPMQSERQIARIIYACEQIGDVKRFAATYSPTDYYTATFAGERLTVRLSEAGITITGTSTDVYAALDLIDEDDKVDGYEDCGE